MTKLLLLLVAVVDMAIGLWVDGVAVTGGGVGGKLGGLEGGRPGGRLLVAVVDTRG